MGNNRSMGDANCNSENTSKKSYTATNVMLLVFLLQRWT